MLIGLGGGGLPNFLHQHIPQVNLSTGIQKLYAIILLIISGLLICRLLGSVINLTVPFDMRK